MSWTDQYTPSGYFPPHLDGNANSFQTRPHGRTFRNAAAKGGASQIGKVHSSNHINLSATVDEKRHRSWEVCNYEPAFARRTGREYCRPFHESSVPTLIPTGHIDSIATNIEHSVSQGFGEVLARLPLPGRHEALPHCFRARIRHRAAGTDTTSPSTLP